MGPDIGVHVHWRNVSTGAAGVAYRGNRDGTLVETGSGTVVAVATVPQPDGIFFLIVVSKISEYARLMRVTRQAAQRDFTDERLLSFAQSLALSLSDEAPGADLLEFERAISMPVAAIGLTTAALAEALRVTHINLDDKEAVAGLSLLSTLGMICADASSFLVPVPRPLLLRIARYLDAAATSVSGGANLPDGLDEANRQNFADILTQDADGIRALANTDDGNTPTLWRTPYPH